MRYLLDTDISSYVVRGKYAGIRKRLVSIPTSEVAISAVTRAELLYGVQRLPGNHALQQAVRQFSSIVQTLAWAASAADQYAEVHHYLVSTGRPIGEKDEMIASHALAIDATLVTNNTRHFERVRPQLRLENWTP